MSYSNLQSPNSQWSPQMSYANTQGYPDDSYAIKPSHVGLIIMAIVIVILIIILIWMWWYNNKKNNCTKQSDCSSDEICVADSSTEGVCVKPVVSTCTPGSTRGCTFGTSCLPGPSGVGYCGFA